MIRYELRPETAEASVTFMVQAQEFTGQTVAVVGEFNDWDPTVHVMDTEAAGGVWTTTIPVPVGRRYAFRYLTEDGTWLSDNDSHGWDDNGLGGRNSVLDLCAAVDGLEAPPVPGVDEPPATMASGGGIPAISEPAHATSAKAARSKPVR